MKEKHAFILKKDVYDSIMAIYRLKNFSCVSDLVNQALEDYLAREVGQKAGTLLSNDVVSVIENTILLSERRINRILFKLAVGDAELKHVVAVASQFRDRDGILKRIHEKSEKEVRGNNGLLSLKTALEQIDEYEVELGE